MFGHRFGFKAAGPFKALRRRGERHAHILYSYTTKLSTMKITEWTPVHSVCIMDNNHRLWAPKQHIRGDFTDSDIFHFTMSNLSPPLHLKPSSWLIGETNQISEPRFPGSVCFVERACGCNMFAALNTTEQQRQRKRWKRETDESVSDPCKPGILLWDSQRRLAYTAAAAGECVSVCVFLTV